MVFFLTNYEKRLIYIVGDWSALYKLHFHGNIRFKTYARVTGALFWTLYLAVRPVYFGKPVLVTCLICLDLGDEK